MSVSTREEIERRVLSVISEVLAIETKNLGADTSIQDDLSPNSMDRIELILTIENEFGGTIPDEDIEKLITVGDVIDYVESHLGTS